MKKNTMEPEDHELHSAQFAEGLVAKLDLNGLDIAAGLVCVMHLYIAPLYKLRTAEAELVTLAQNHLKDRFNQESTENKKESTK